MSRPRKVVPTELESYEAEIAESLRSFVKVGWCLCDIRSLKLYREAGFESFDEYCAKRWQFKANYAHKLIAASLVVDNCTQAGLPAPSTESQARELIKLEPEAQAEAWAEAVETAPPSGVTAKHVAAVVAARLPPVGPKAAKATTIKEEPERAALPVPVTKIKPDALKELERLRAQRDADPEFESFRASQRRIALNKQMPRVNFILDGGELALVRLGLDWSATPDSTRKAYRLASTTAHPDRGGPTEEFISLTRARDMVLDYLARSTGAPR